MSPNGDPRDHVRRPFPQRPNPSRLRGTIYPMSGWFSSADRMQTAAASESSSGLEKGQCGRDAVVGKNYESDASAGASQGTDQAGNLAEFQPATLRERRRLARSGRCR